MGRKNLRTLYFSGSEFSTLLVTNTGANSCTWKHFGSEVSSYGGLNHQSRQDNLANLKNYCMLYMDHREFKLYHFWNDSVSAHKLCICHFGAYWVKISISMKICIAYIIKAINPTYMNHIETHFFLDHS